MSRTSERNETEVSPAGTVRREGDGDDVGHMTVLVILDGGRVGNADIATSGSHWKVLLSTRSVPI